MRTEKRGRTPGGAFLALSDWSDELVASSASKVKPSVAQNGSRNTKMFFFCLAFDIVIEYKTMYADKQCLILQIRKRNEGMYASLKPRGQHVSSRLYFVLFFVCSVIDCRRCAFLSNPCYSHHIHIYTVRIKPRSFNTLLGRETSP